MNNNKILAIDYGMRNIGLAASDELGIIAARLPGLKVKTQEEAIEGVNLLVQSLNIGKILLGMPDKGEIKKQIINFKKDLKNEVGCEIIEWNEDFSSKQAEKGTSKKFKKEKSHSEAAREILQAYLDSVQNKQI